MSNDAAGFASAADRSVASPEGLSTLGSALARFQTRPPACYRASWQLPGPDLHRQATTSFRSGHDRWTITSCSLGAPAVVLACFVDTPGRFFVGALIASVAIDVDHIPLYLGLLGNPAQRPLTHSLSAVAVFAAAAAASRRHRAMLAGVTAGLVLHFARDIAEGYPGVRVFWPLQDTSWLVSYRWFLGMIVVFTVARLVLVSVGLPRTRILVFRTPSPSGSIPRSPDGPAASGDRRPGLESHKLFRSDRHK